MQYICAVNTSDMTPLLQEMLAEMRKHLSVEDIRAGLPEGNVQSSDISPLYGEWSSLRKTEARQLERIAELDADIQHMEPWGDYPMARVDQLAQRSQSLLFWRCSRVQYDAHSRQWKEDYQAELVSERNGQCYFVTVTPQGVSFVLPDAHQEQVAPSPVSTLITLQTKAKDSLKQIRIQMGDFSLQHYREVEAALHLSNTLVVPSRWNRLWALIRLLIRKLKLKKSKK